MKRLVVKWNRLGIKTKVFILIFALEIILALFVIVITYNITYQLYDTNDFSKKLSNLSAFVEIIGRDYLFILLLFCVIIITSLIGSYLFYEIISKPLIDIISKDKFQSSRKKAFIGAISHELKTPITIISGQLEGMIHRIGKYKDRDLYLQKCYDTTQDMKYLVNRMMEISKKDILHENSDKTEIDINDIIVKVVNKHRYMLDTNKISIELSLNSQSHFWGNEEDIITVLSNILNNAIIYSPDDNVIRISTSERKTSINTYVIDFYIENTGVVLTREQIENIFDPLYRIEASRNRNTGGSGLGLYFVSHILTNHGFKYEMFSKANSTVFYIEFKPYDINYIYK